MLSEVGDDDINNTHPIWLYFGNTAIYLDTVKLEQFFEDDITQDCPFLENFDIGSLLSNEDCQNEAYNFSNDLLQETTFKVESFDDLDRLLKGVGKVLKTCGHPEFGKLVGTIFDSECLNVFDEIEQLLKGFSGKPNLASLLEKLPSIL